MFHCMIVHLQRAVAYADLIALQSVTLRTQYVFIQHVCQAYIVACTMPNQHSMLAVQWLACTMWQATTLLLHNARCTTPPLRTIGFTICLILLHLHHVSASMCFCVTVQLSNLFRCDKRRHGMQSKAAIHTLDNVHWNLVMLICWSQDNLTDWLSKQVTRVSAFANSFVHHMLLPDGRCAAAGTWLHVSVAESYAMCVLNTKSFIVISACGYFMTCVHVCSGNISAQYPHLP